MDPDMTASADHGHAHLRLSIPALLAFVAGLILLAAPLSACSPGAGGGQNRILRWEPDDDANLTYGILLLDQGLRDNDAELVMSAIPLLAERCPTSRPFVDASAWLLFNRLPALAREAVGPALERFPDDLNPHVYMAEAWLADKEQDRAVAVLQAYQAAHPASLPARRVLAIIYAKAARFAEAAGMFADLPDASLPPDARYYYARALTGTGRTDEAVVQLRRAVADEPDFAEAWTELGAIYEARKEYRQAASLYEYVLEQNLEVNTAWLRLIAVWLKAGDVDAALDAATNHPGFASLPMAAAMPFFERKLYPQAEYLLREAQKNGNMQEEINFYLAVAVHEGRRDAAEALRRLDAIPESHPLYPRSLRLRAQILFAEKKTEDALQLLRDAQTRFPADTGFCLLEAYLLNQEQRHAPALAALDRALERHPQDPDLLYNRGMTLDAVGRREEALAVMESILVINADYYQALNYVGYFLAERKQDLPRALELLYKANKLSPDTPHIVDSLAWAQFHSGQLDEAWANIRKAVGLEGGEDAVIWEHYGDIALARGNRAEAMRAYARALEQGHDQPDHIRDKMNRP
jgi:tetratricopeptide (TPR) repeat protein